MIKAQIVTELLTAAQSLFQPEMDVPISSLHFAELMTYIGVSIGLHANSHVCGLISALSSCRVRSCRQLVLVNILKFYYLFQLISSLFHYHSRLRKPPKPTRFQT